MKYLNPIDETARALAFLTRLPVPDRFFNKVKTEQANHSAAFYPIAGLVIGLMSSVILIIASALSLSAFLVASLSILAIVGVTGALHEDGLGDVADGFGGGATIENRLSIMKDSRLGTYGVIAIVASLLLRIGALTTIIELTGALAGILALLASAGASRGAMVWLWASLPSARNGGVAGRLGAPPDNVVSIAAILGLTIGVVFGLFASGFLPTGMAIGLSLIAMLGFQKLCLRMIGGQTGDTIGACQQIVETSFLLGLAMQLPLANY